MEMLTAWSAPSPQSIPACLIEQGHPEIVFVEIASISEMAALGGYRESEKRFELLVDTRQLGIGPGDPLPTSSRSR